MLESLFNKIEALQACILRSATLLKRDSSYRCFLMNIAKPLRTPISKNILKMFGCKKKSLKYVIINFHVFVRKPVLKMCAEQLISGAVFQIGQNN